MTDVVLFAAYTASSVIGLLLLGASLYVASFAVWLVILARHELSSAYPAAIGLTLAFSTLGAVLLLNEALNVARLVGIALIFLGIFLVTRY